MKTIKRISRLLARGERGFTLIELLAVMSIVAVLAGIVSTSVSGTGDTSATTAAQQDATTVNSGGAEFFTGQEGAALIIPHTVTVKAFIADVADSETGDVTRFDDASASVVQKTNSRWPEQYITDDRTGVAASIYSLEFPIAAATDDPSGGDVVRVTIRGKKAADGTPGDLILRSDFLSQYTAIDFTALEDGNFLDFRPDSALETTEGGFRNFLWLFRKSTAAGGSGRDDSRTIAVFKLVTVQVLENASGENDAGDVELTYDQIF